MRRFVVIATANRGNVDPPEPLDEVDEPKAEFQWRRDWEADSLAIARRVAKLFSRERDRRMTPTQEAREMRKELEEPWTSQDFRAPGKKPVGNWTPAEIDRAVSLAGKAGRG
jgi:hypothetical protein